MIKKLKKKMKNCLHDKYVSAEFRRDKDRGFWNIDRFWRVPFNTSDIVSNCEECGEDITNLYLTKYEK